MAMVRKVTTGGQNEALSVENRKLMANEPTSGLAPGLIGATLNARYRLESKLGSGGMSTVYLARDETLERSVAVKVLHREISDDPAQLERFRREARSVAQLSHPNVVAVIDAGEDGGHPYIVFEYIEGDTLKQRTDRAGRLPLDEAVAYAIEIGRGLAAAHARRLVHRDVKPQNVLIDPEGRAKVTDFGIARELESDGLTKTGRVLGTTDYVSPEQAMGREVDARSDIYSLGVLLYEMLTGHVPFVAETVVGVAMKHVNEEMPNVQKRRPEVSAALAAVIERATAKDPKNRYPDMGSLLAELEGALEVEVARAGSTSGEATAVLDSVPEPRRKLLTRRHVSVAGILLVAAAGIAAIVIAVLAGDDEGRRGGALVSGDDIEIASARSFDPQGEGQEHEEEVRFAIDGDSETTWTTESYNLPVINDSISTKDGVGLYVSTEQPVAPLTMSVTSPVGGWDAAVYGAPAGPPAEIEGWGEELGSVDGAPTNAEIQLTATDENQFFLLWFTKVAPSSDEFGGNRAEISEIELIGSG
jgi:serine/threonine-protein kinase